MPLSNRFRTRVRFPAASTNNEIATSMSWKLRFFLLASLYPFVPFVPSVANSLYPSVPSVAHRTSQKGLSTASATMMIAMSAVTELTARK